jgi:hypothetical protein
MTLSRAVWSTALLLVGTIVPGRPASAQVYRLADMNTRQVQALDRQRTVVLIPGGTSIACAFRSRARVCRRSSPSIRSAGAG